MSLPQLLNSDDRPLLSTYARDFYTITQQVSIAPRGGHTVSGALYRRSSISIEKPPRSCFSPPPSICTFTPALLDPLAFLELGKYPVDSRLAQQIIATMSDVVSGEQLSLHCELNTSTGYSSSMV